MNYKDIAYVLTPPALALTVSMTASASELISIGLLTPALAVTRSTAVICWARLTPRTTTRILHWQQQRHLGSGQTHLQSAIAAGEPTAGRHRQGWQSKR